MVLLYGYLSVAGLFYLASLAELRRTRARGVPRNAADAIILHLVAVMAALLWLVALPFLLRVVKRRLQPHFARLQGWAVRVSHRRTHLAS